MARSGRPKAELVLTAHEHEQLTRWARRASSSQALALRSKIVLGCARGLDNKVVAEQVGCEEHTVSKWRRRFVEHRLDGLGDEPRSGRPRTISVDQVEDVIVATLESTPANATHWSRSKMAERTGLSRSTIGKIWSDFGLKPHLVDHFKLSTDPLFIDKLYDVVGLYLNPPRPRWCCAWTRSPRSRRCSDPSRRSRGCPGCASAGPTTTSGTAPPRCSRR